MTQTPRPSARRRHAPQQDDDNLTAEVLFIRTAVLFTRRWCSLSVDEVVLNMLIVSPCRS